METLFGLFSHGSSLIALLGVVFGGIGVVWGVFKHQESKTASAETDTAKEQAAKQKIIADNAVASTDATQKALSAVMGAVADRVATEASIPTAPGAAKQALIDEGFTK